MDKLTPRQLQTLHLYALTASHAETAHQMKVTIRTVKVHCSHAYERLDVNNHIDAFRVLGWLRVPKRVRYG